MSLPPTTVQIKRKRTDEPIEYLRVHDANGKRQRVLNGYVFERQPQIVSPTAPSTPKTTHLGGRHIKPLHRTASSQSLGRSTNDEVDRYAGNDLPLHDANNDGEQQAASSISNGLQSKQQKSHIRRFHISRNNNLENSKIPGHRKDTPIVFVERRVPQSRKQAISETSTDDKITISRPQKKPGRNARIPIAQNTLPTPRPGQSDAIPEAFKNRWNVPSEELAREMEAYALQEIASRLAQQTITHPPLELASANQGQGHTKFKPNTSVKRYAERHPDAASMMDDEMQLDHDDTGEEQEEETLNEQDYVTEIYVRVPIDALERTVINAGLLILDSQPDIDAFYGQDDDSDEDDEFDDEDENAENHYSADYPDEEIDSDDEYGRNVYNYRTHASDDEYDDVAYSDSDEELCKDSWKKRHHAGPLHDLYA